MKKAQIFFNCNKRNKVFCQIIRVWGQHIFCEDFGERTWKSGCFWYFKLLSIFNTLDQLPLNTRKIVFYHSTWGKFIQTSFLGQKVWQYIFEETNVLIGIYWPFGSFVNVQFSHKSGKPGPKMKRIWHCKEKTINLPGNFCFSCSQVLFWEVFS